MGIPCTPETNAHPRVIQIPMPLNPERKKNRSNTHNGTRRNNQLENISLIICTGEVPSVGSVLETFLEQRTMKNQFKTFQDTVKRY